MCGLGSKLSFEDDKSLLGQLFVRYAIREFFEILDPVIQNSWGAFLIYIV